MSFPWALDLSPVQLSFVTTSFLPATPALRFQEQQQLQKQQTQRGSPCNCSPRLRQEVAGRKSVFQN